MTSYRRTMTISVYKGPTLVCTVDEKIRQWFASFAEILRDHHGVTLLRVDITPASDALEIEFEYKNCEEDWDEGRMYADSFIADPDDDGNYPLDGCTVFGSVLTLSERQEVHYGEIGGYIQ